MNSNRILGVVISLYKGTKGTILEVEKDKIINICYLPKCTLYIETFDTICFDTYECLPCKWGKHKNTPAYTIPYDKCEVVVPDNDDSVLSAFTSCFGANRGMSLYDKFIDDIFPIEIPEPNKWLNSNAEYEVSSHTSYSKIYSWWIYHRLKRRLLNLGLNYDMIDKAMYYEVCDTLYDLYIKILKNPLIIVALPLELSIDLSNRLDISFTPVELQYARIAHTLYDYTEIHKHSSMPCDVLEKEYPLIQNLWEILSTTYKLCIEFNCYYFDVNWIRESGLSQAILTLLKSDPTKYSVPIEYTRTDLHEEQRRAVALSLDMPLNIITGGAGNGKTTIIKELVHNLKKRKIPYLLSSFTGKAVARIREVTNNYDNVLTLHMILTKRLTTTHLVIDEASMVTTSLLYDILSSGNYQHVTLIGDPNQLPPIQWGHVLSQLLKIPSIPHIHLNYNHRTNARVTALNKNGELVPTKDCTISNGNIDSVLEIYTNLINMGISTNDIIILSPVNNCVNEINLLAQKAADKGLDRLSDVHGNTFMVGDCVMLVENDKNGGNNGDLGRVVDINLSKKSINVQFSHDNRSFTISKTTSYIRDDRSKTTEVLKLAYAITIHKSQGSQWRYVIIYIPPGYKDIPFYNFYLIYTAISRTMHRLYILGDIPALQYALKWIPPPRTENLTNIIMQS